MLTMKSRLLIYQIPLYRETIKERKNMAIMDRKWLQIPVEGVPSPKLLRNYLNSQMRDPGLWFNVCR